MCVKGEVGNDNGEEEEEEGDRGGERGMVEEEDVGRASALSRVEARKWEGGWGDDDKAWVSWSTGQLCSWLEGDSVGLGALCSAVRANALDGFTLHAILAGLAPPQGESRGGSQFGVVESGAATILFREAFFGAKEGPHVPVGLVVKLLARLREEP